MSNSSFVTIILCPCRMCIKDVCSAKLFQRSGGRLFIINVVNFKKKNLVSFSVNQKKIFLINVFFLRSFFLVLKRFYLFEICGLMQSPDKLLSNNFFYSSFLFLQSIIYFRSKID